MTWINEHMTGIIIVIVPIVIFIALLIYYNLSLDEKDHWSKTISIVGGIITAVSLLWAACTYYDSANRQRELSAYNIYQEHQKLSIAHPELASGEMAPKPPKEDNPNRE